MRFLLLLTLPVFLLLTACSGRRDTLFTVLEADQTGLHFSNTIIENDSINILTFEYAYNGGGVGVGDFNNDGLMDVFFAGNQVRSRLFLNKGKQESHALQFDDVTESAGIASPHWNTGVSVVDINQDGLLDIYVCTISPIRGKSAPNQFFINQGIKTDANGRAIPTFRDMATELGLADRSYSTQAVFFDYDLDGDLDCYLLNNALESFNRNEIRRPVVDGSGKSTDRLYENVGTGKEEKEKSGARPLHPHFKDVSAQTGITQEGWGLGVGVADLNDDGYPDVYCANDFQSNDLAWINEPDGKSGHGRVFRNRIGAMLRHQSHNSMGCDIADINNDGLPDIMTLDMMPYTNRRIKAMFGVPSYDRYELNFQLGYQPQFVRNALQLNRGKSPAGSLPQFSEIGQLAGVFATDWSWSPLFADFDNDGLRDLFITNGYPRDVTDLDFMAYNAESAMFGDSVSRKRGIEQKMNGLEGVYISNFMFRNQGADPNTPPTFADVTAEWGVQRNSYSNGAAYADFDNDGDLDIVVNNLNGEAFLYRNNLNNNETQAKTSAVHYVRFDLRDPQTHQAGYGTKLWVYAGTHRWYAEHTPYRGYKSSVEPVVHIGLGAVSRLDSVVVEWPGGRRVTFTTLSVDQTHQLARQEGRIQPMVPLNPGHPLLEPASFFSFTHTENAYTDLNDHVLWRQLYSRSGPYLTKGDVNGDGRDDVVVGGSAGSGTTLFMQTAGGQFSQQLIDPDHPEEDCGLALFDADGDHDLDLYAVSGGSEFGSNSPALQDRLYLNNGRGQFTRQLSALPDTRASGSCVRACDYDHDGDLDLFVGGRLDSDRYPAAPRSYLLRNNTRENRSRPQPLPLFTDITPPALCQIGMVTDGQWADLDNDHWEDLLLVGEFMPVTLLKNERGQSFVPSLSESFTSSKGWWNCVVTADFDHDGDLDIVAGNFGLNTRFRASSREPVSIYAKDYDNNGRIDPILCYYVQGREVPVHPRDALALQIPALKKKFPSYAQYGTMAFSDLLTESERAGGFSVQATELRSVYFENRQSEHRTTNGSDDRNFVMTPLPAMAQVSTVNQLLVDDVDGDGHPDLILAENLYATDPQIGRQDAGLGLVLRGLGNGRFTPVSPGTSGLNVPGDARSLLLMRVGNQRLIVAGCNRDNLLVFRY